MVRVKFEAGLRTRPACTRRPLRDQMGQYLSRHVEHSEGPPARKSGWTGRSQIGWLRAIVQATSGF